MGRVHGTQVGGGGGGWGETQEQRRESCQPGPGSQACPGARGQGGRSSRRPRPRRAPSCCRFRGIAGPAAPPSRVLDPTPDLLNQRPSPPGFKQPSGGFRGSSWAALSWRVWCSHLLLCWGSGTLSFLLAGCDLSPRRLWVAETLPTWPKRLGLGWAPAPSPAPREHQRIFSLLTQIYIWNRST